ncbi:NlpC/P60 family protein [Corynebacterium macclintockiae]|uniref:NlpC/P60 family protein n=1 Tax=Corynebacterium macclintockiae TaxID=2913501 RepID=UPI003EBB966D
MSSSSRDRFVGSRALTKAATAALLSLAVGTSLPQAGADPQDARNNQQEAQNQGDKGDKKAEEVRRLLDAPIPKDVDGLLNHVKEISNLASETSDEVEQLKIDIKQAEGNLGRANKTADDAKKRADKLAVDVKSSRANVTGVSQAMYRGATVDPVSAFVGSQGPQAAVERSSYLATIGNQRTDAVDNLTRKLKDAAKEKNKASRSKATADFQLRTLNDRKSDLEDRNKQLDRLKDKVMKVVDDLSPEDRRRWADRNGPIDVDVEAFLGGLKGKGDSGAPVNATGVVAAALSKIGSPYSWGATGPSAFDCSGLMYWAYQQQGKTIPRTSSAQIAGGQSVSINDLQPGDIVGYYPGVTHVGMYIGDGKVVHASDYGIPVQVVPLNSMPVQGAARY